MRVSEKLELIDAIARELQSRYTFPDISTYLSNFGVSTPEGSFNSKWVYSKEALTFTDETTLSNIAEDLEIPGHVEITRNRKPPKVWADNSNFRLFVSHLAKDAKIANRTKEVLKGYGISAFVAHDDIPADNEWQSEIEKALSNMDAMLTIHTKGFSKSNWTQQEIGFALGANVKIISVKFDEDPSAFISKRQAVLRRGRKAEAVAEEIFQILLNDERTGLKLEKSNTYLTIEEDLPF